MTPITTFAERDVALFGLGGSGLATAQALKAGGARVRAWDDNPESVARAAEAGIERRTVYLTNAVKQVGLDRKAIRDYVAGNTHKTIIGDIRFAGSENVGTPGTVGQWQNGEFEVVWPKARATAALNANKPAWK